MSYFNERHPPMGSEKNVNSNQTIYNTDHNIIHQSGSNSDELDELSLRVRVLLSETVNDFSLNPLHQDQQPVEDSQPDKADPNVKVSYSALDGECPQYSDLKYLPKKKEEENVSRCIYEDLIASDSDVIVLKMPEWKSQSLTSCKIYDHSNLKDSSYSFDEAEKKNASSSCLEKHVHENSSTVKQASFFTNQCPYLFTRSEECKEHSACNISDYSVLSPALFEFHSSNNKDENDYEASLLSASSIASSKFLEWDNAADIGYAINSADNISNCKRNRKEPEGYSVRTEINSKTSQHATDLKNELFRHRSEKKEQSQNFYPYADTSSRNLSKSDENKDFNSESFDKHNQNNSLCNIESSPLLSRDNSLKDLKIQKSDISVRPKDKIYIEVCKQSEKKHAMKCKKTINFKPENKCSTANRKIQLHENETVQDKNIDNNGEFDRTENKVSFISGYDNYTYTNHSRDIPYSEQYKSCMYSVLPESVDFYSQIISTPIYIDSDTFTSQDFPSQSADNKPNQESFPHIRWYPLPAYKNFQDIKNASSQTLDHEHSAEERECLDNTNVELKSSDENILFSTQMNESLEIGMNETHLSDSYPHVIKSLIYETVFPSIQT